MSPSSVGVRVFAPTLLLGGGIIGFCWCDASLSNKLSALFPATTAGPRSPPVVIFATDSRLSPPDDFLSSWQATQLARRMGAISESKSTGLVRTGTSTAIGPSAKRVEPQRHRAHREKTDK